MSGGLSIPEIKTTLDEGGSVILKSRTWHLIQTTADSIGFFVDSKPYYLHFEPVKQYYFIVQTSYGSRPVVTEKSEREFILTATIESIKGPEIHILNKINN